MRSAPLPQNLLSPKSTTRMSHFHFLFSSQLNCSCARNTYRENKPQHFPRGYPTAKHVIINFTSDNDNKLTPNEHVLEGTKPTFLISYRRNSDFHTFTVIYSFHCSFFYHTHSGIELGLKIVKGDDRRSPSEPTLWYLNFYGMTEKSCTAGSDR